MDRQRWTCQVHTLERAVASCASCSRAMCAQCVAEGDGNACGPCAAVHRRQQRRLRLMALAVLPVIGGAVALGVVGRRNASRREAEQAAQARAVPEERMSCDRAAAISVGEGLLQQDKPQQALDLAGRFFRQCGEFPRLRWITFSAYKRLERLDEAIGEAGRLIEDRPNDADFWWWRGELEERRGRREAAAADYRQSLANRPLMLRLPIDLYDVYMHAQRPCEALVTMERYLDVHPDIARDWRTARRTEQARLRGDGCADFAGTGTATFQPSPADSLVRAPIHAVRAKGAEASGTFVVDEQSGYTVVTKAFAERLGLAPGAEVTVAIAGKASPARLALLDDLSAGAARARKVEVAIVERLPVSEDGLLGLSFLWRFEWQKRNGGLTLSQRRSPAKQRR